MKAYKVWDKTNDDAGQDIVWANNVKESKRKGTSTQVGQQLDQFMDLKVKRCPEFDNMENLSSKDFMKQQWIKGWYWWDASYLPHYEELANDDVSRIMYDGGFD